MRRGVQVTRCDGCAGGTRAQLVTLRVVVTGQGAEDHPPPVMVGCTVGAVWSKDVEYGPACPGGLQEK